MCIDNSKLRERHIYIYTHTEKKLKIMTKTQTWKEVVKTSDFRICSNLRDHQPKIDCYEHSLLYMKYIGATDQKSMRERENK